MSQPTLPRPLNSLQLKLLAMAIMLIDHIYHALFPQYVVLNIIGRLAFPMFAFQLSESCFHTRNPGRFLGRLALFALISEIPFDLMAYGTIYYPYHQNIMFTLLIAAGGVLLMERIGNTGNRGLFYLTAFGIVFLGYLVGTLLFVDYSGWGVLTVFLFTFFRSQQYKLAWVGQLAGILLIHAILLVSYTVPFTLGSLVLNIPIQAWAVFSLIPIWLYNGQPGPTSKAIQYACYTFYPLHLLILGLLSLWLF